MLKSKLTTVGNSSGLIPPKEVLAKLKAQKGDTLYWLETPNGYELVAYNPDFVEQMELAQQIMKEDVDVLKALSK